MQKILTLLVTISLRIYTVILCFHTFVSLVPNFVSCVLPSFALSSRAFPVYLTPTFVMFADLAFDHDLG